MAAKALKTYVRSDDGNVFFVDTIEHDGKLWLVPKWILSPDKRSQTPAHIIRLDGLPYRSNNSPIPVDLELLCTIPRTVLDGTAPPDTSSEIVVVYQPDISRKPNDPVH